MIASEGFDPIEETEKLQHATGGNAVQFLLFGQGESQFAIDLMSVREVLFLKQQSICAVPNTLPYLIGLTNLRGEILAVADFGRFMGAEPVDPDSPQSRILVVEVPNGNNNALSNVRMGLALSRVYGVISVNRDRIVSSIDVSEEVAPFLRGLYDLNGSLVMILDIEALAQSERW
jgi:chemotaxis signal transduction protein